LSVIRDHRVWTFLRRSEGEQVARRLGKEYGLYKAGEKGCTGAISANSAERSRITLQSGGESQRKCVNQESKAPSGRGR